MSLIWMDGFDWCTVDAASDVALAQVYTSVSPTLRVVSNGRYDKGLMRDSSTGDVELRKSFPAALQDATMFVGLALTVPDIATARTFLFMRSDANATTHLSFRVMTSGEIAVYRGNVATLLGTTSGAAILADTWNYIEIKAVLHDTTGAITIRVNGVTRLTLTNQDTKNAGTNTKFEDVCWVSTSGAGTGMRLDDLYVLNSVDSGVSGQPNNDFLGDVRVELIPPTGAGTTAQFTRGGADSGANWSQVEELVPASGAADTDYNESSNVGDKDTFAMANLASTSGAVAGVMVTSLAKKTDSGARGLKNVVRSAGSETDSADNALATSYAGYSSIFEAEPGGSAWTRSEVDAMEAGYKVGS